MDFLELQFRLFGLRIFLTLGVLAVPRDPAGTNRLRQRTRRRKRCALGPLPVETAVGGEFEIRLAITVDVDSVFSPLKTVGADRNLSQFCT